MQATTETVELLAAYYSAMEANQPEDYGSYYATDMTLTFANSPTLHGKEQILSAFAEMLDQVESLGHDLRNVWQDDAGTIFFESLGRWTLHGGDVVEIKAASVIQLRDGKFADQRIYVDNAPVYEALAREREQHATP